MRFYLRQVKAIFKRICWLVFSSVDRFVLKIQHNFFTMRDIALSLGNMLPARKHRFSIYFGVLSDQYVEESAYANVFKFNRENKRFEIQMFPLVSGRHVGAPQTTSNMASPY